LALEPGLGEAGRVPGRGRKPLVAVASGAASRDHQPLAVGEQLGLRAVKAVDDRPRRDGNHPVLPALAVLPGALAVLATPGPEVPAAAQGSQIAALGVADQHDIAAAAPPPAIGPAARAIRLAPAAYHVVP